MRSLMRSAHCLRRGSRRRSDRGPCHACRSSHAWQGHSAPARHTQSFPFQVQSFLASSELSERNRKDCRLRKSTDTSVTPTIANCLSRSQLIGRLGHSFAPPRHPFCTGEMPAAAGVLRNDAPPGFNDVKSLMSLCPTLVRDLPLLQPKGVELCRRTKPNSATSRGNCLMDH